MDFYETVYSRAPLADKFNLAWCASPRTTQIVPGTATHWAQTSPTTWEFYIRPGIMWSDGNELTANDYVETFRYSADPKHAWDFTWYWSGVIKNYTEAVAGKAPVNSIGVSVGKNKYTFVVTTEGPVAFIPNAMLYSMPLSAAGLAKYGNGAVQHQPGYQHHVRALHPEDLQPDVRGRARPEHEVHRRRYKPMIEYQISKIYAGADELPLFETGGGRLDAAMRSRRPTWPRSPRQRRSMSHMHA